MMAGLHRHTLDFDIIQGNNIRTFFLVDESNYMEPPENPVYEIIVPGFSNSVRINYIPNQALVLNSSLLGLSAYSGTDIQLFDLPDGIYSITQQIDPADILYRSREYLRTNQLERKYDRLLVRLAFSGNRERQLVNYIIQLDILLQSAKAEARLCNSNKAINKYRLADQLADKLLKQTKQ